VCARGRTAVAKEEACACGRAAAVDEEVAQAASTTETDRVVEGTWRELRQFFGNPCEASRGGLLFIGSKLSESVHK
jgi:hypothetical protein